MLQITADTLSAIYPHAGIYRTQVYAPILSHWCEKFSINTPLRLAHFLAQIGHESGELRYTEELASGVAYEGRKDLGNCHNGDGVRFKGRGLIQLTGRANYSAFSRYIGVDYVAHPELVKEPTTAVAVSCWFWHLRQLNRYADNDDIKAITRRVNGGYNGLDSRQVYLTRAKKVFGISE